MTSKQETSIYLPSHNACIIPYSIPSLHTEKQVFQCAVLQSWELCLRMWLYSYKHIRTIQSIAASGRTLKILKNRESPMGLI